MAPTCPAADILSTKNQQQIFQPPLLPDKGLLPPKSRPLLSTRATTHALLLSEKRHCVVLESPAGIALLFHPQSSCACFSYVEEQEFCHFCFYTECRISRRRSKRHSRHLGNSGALALREKVRHFPTTSDALNGGRWSVWYRWHAGVPIAGFAGCHCTSNTCAQPYLFSTRAHID